MEFGNGIVLTESRKLCLKGAMASYPCREVFARGVGQDHVHYKALAKIFLLKVVLLPGASNKSHNNGCIVIIDDYYYY